MSRKLVLSGRGRKLAAALRQGADEASLARLGVDAATIWSLEAAGLLEEPGESLLPEDYADAYSGWRSQKGMLIDAARTLAFNRAIRSVVAEGDRVIDVGAGSGILSMFAARAGAGQVHALEYTAMADWAERLATNNDLAAMQVVRGDAAAFRSEQLADVVMGEFAGMWLIEEWWHYAAFVKVRDRLLKPGGRVVPAAARLFLSAVDSRKLHLERGWGFFDQPVYGFDFSDVFRLDGYRPARYILSAEPKSLIATSQIARFDYLTGTERDYLFSTEAQFSYPAGGMFHGFIGHFDLELAPGEILSTSCAAPETHWHQSYFPMPALHVPAGQAVTARLRSFLTPGTEVLKFGITVAGPGQALDAQAEHVFDLE